MRVLRTSRPPVPGRCCRGRAGWGEGTSRAGPGTGRTAAALRPLPGGAEPSGRNSRGTGALRPPPGAEPPPRVSLPSLRTRPYQHLHQQLFLNYFKRIQAKSKEGSARCRAFPHGRGRSARRWEKLGIPGGKNPTTLEQTAKQPNPWSHRLGHRPSAARSRCPLPPEGTGRGWRVPWEIADGLSIT